jgi:hypothetical protein
VVNSYSTRKHREGASLPTVPSRLFVKNSLLFTFSFTNMQTLLLVGPNRVMIFGSLRWRTGEGESLKWLGSHSRMNEVNSHPTRKYRDGAGPPAVPSRLFVESNHFSQTLLYEQANFLMVGAQPISLNELIPFTSRQYLRIRAPAHGGDRVAAAVGTQF